MFVDVVDLREFYGKPLGRAARLSLGGAIAGIWNEAPVQDANGNSQIGLCTAGLGYCTPWLDRYRRNGERVIALMPAAQGAVRWPTNGPSATVLVHSEELPLPDSSVDRMLMVHMLEHTYNPAAALKEAWRVLAPGGRLLIAVPNRRGLWARMEHTPFGAGRPFSRGQLDRLLRDTMLTPVTWSDALHFPPVRRASAIRLYSRLERIGRRLWPAFSGVIMVEATKQLYQGLPADEKVRERVLVPAMAPQGASMGASMDTSRGASSHLKTGFHFS